jgi:SAM-dependent methyltransferase
LKQELLQSLGNQSKKRVLVLGCGNDSAAVWFSKSGADVDAIDISPKSVEHQRTIAELLRLEITCFVMDANNLDLPKNEYDFVYGNAILHHLDVKKCCEEISRVLKPGGKAVFRDVMKGNALLQLFRLVTPFWRTEDEHPLTNNDFVYFNQTFTHCNIKQFILSGLPYFLFARIMNDVILKKLRVKFKIPLPNSIYSFFDKLDEILFTLLPFTKSQAWICLVTLKN